MAGTEAHTKGAEMPCTTHHFACECREEKVREMCEYLLAYDKSLDPDWSAIEAAVEIALELYPEAQREDSTDA